MIITCCTYTISINIFKAQKASMLKLRATLLGVNLGCRVYMYVASCRFEDFYEKSTKTQITYYWLSGSVKIKHTVHFCICVAGASVNGLDTVLVCLARVQKTKHMLLYVTVVRWSYYSNTSRLHACARVFFQREHLNASYKAASSTLSGWREMCTE